MDSRYYMRMAFSGWLFIAVLLLGWGLGGHPYWEMIRNFLSSESSYKNLMNLFILFIAGVSGPPAFGFIIYTFARFIRIIPREIIYEKCGHIFQEEANKIRENLKLPKEKYYDGDLTTAFMYHYFKPDLRNWLTGRGTSYYSHMTSCYSVAFAILILFFTFSQWTNKLVVIILIFFLIVFIFISISLAVKDDDHRKKVAKIWLMEILPVLLKEDYQDNNISKPNNEQNRASNKNS